MGNKRRRGKKNSQPSKRRKRFAPKKLWAEDCLELLPPEDDDGGSFKDTNSQLWVKITANVIPNLVQDTQQDCSTVEEATATYLGPKGAWLVETVSSTLRADDALTTEDVKVPATSHKGTPSSFVASETAGDEDGAPLQGNSTPPTTEKMIFIQRLAVSIPKVPKKPLHHLPNGDCGDGIQNPHKDVPDKYWAQRRSLFSKIDEGIQMVDAESWYSVTPELIARHIAARMCSSSAGKKIVLDAFCGVGGNAIAFALRDDVELVVCVDTDQSKLKAAANNCHVYGVPKDKVVFVHDDVCVVLQQYRKGLMCAMGTNKQDAATVQDPQQETSEFRLGGLELLPSRLDSIFLSPPWGGIDYMEHGHRHFNLDCIKLPNAIQGKELLRLSSNALRIPHLALFLPRNLNGLMVAQDCYELGVRGTIEVERSYVEHKLKTITMYIQPED